MKAMHTELSFKLWILACGLCQIQPPPTSETIYPEQTGSHRWDRLL